MSAMFRICYVVPTETVHGLTVPADDDVLVFAVDTDGLTIEFSMGTTGSTLEITTDLDATAVLRGEPAALTAVLR